MDEALRLALDDIPAEVLRIKITLDDLPRDRDYVDLPDTTDLPPADINLLNWQVWGFLKSITMMTNKIDTHGFNLIHLEGRYPGDIEQEIVRFINKAIWMVQVYDRVYPNPFKIPDERNKVKSRRPPIDFNQPFMLQGELFSKMAKFRAKVQEMKDRLSVEVANELRQTLSNAFLEGFDPSLYLPWDRMKRLKHIVLFLRLDGDGHKQDFETFWNFFAYKDTSTAHESRDGVAVDGLFYTDERDNLETLSLFFLMGGRGEPLPNGLRFNTVEEANAFYLGDARTCRLTMDTRSFNARLALTDLLSPNTRDQYGDWTGRLCDIFRQFAI